MTSLTSNAEVFRACSSLLLRSSTLQRSSRVSWDSIQRVYSSNIRSKIEPMMRCAPLPTRRLTPSSPLSPDRRTDDYSVTPLASYTALAYTALAYTTLTTQHWLTQRWQGRPHVCVRHTMRKPRPLGGKRPGSLTEKGSAGGGCADRSSVLERRSRIRAAVTIYRQPIPKFEDNSRSIINFLGRRS